MATNRKLTKNKILQKYYSFQDTGSKREWDKEEKGERDRVKRVKLRNIENEAEVETKDPLPMENVLLRFAWQTLFWDTGSTTNCKWLMEKHEYSDIV